MAKLKKTLSKYSLTMVVIGSCLGSGIFLTPSSITAQLQSPALILLVWGIGGIIAISGALTYGELGAMFPRAGGIYVFLKEAYGNLTAFLYGWATLMVVTTGAIAALALAFANYVSFVIPLSDIGIKALAIGAIVVITIINILGVKWADLFTNLFTGAKLIGILVVVGIGLFFGASNTNSYTFETAAMPDNLVTTIGLAFIGVLFSYGGFHHASYLAAESKDAKRSIPFAMVVGTIVVTVAYLLTNLAYLYLMPAAAIATTDSLAADAVGTVFAWGGVFVAILIAISTFGTAGIYTLSAPRIYFAMANDGLFFKSVARVHSKYKTPTNAIIFQSAWAIVLLLFWGTFHDLVTYIVFVDWIFLMLAAASIFIFRFKRNNEERSYKTLGYPVTPAVFVLIALFIVGNTLISSPTHAWIGLGFLAWGVLFYYYFKTTSKRWKKRILRTNIFIVLAMVMAYTGINHVLPYAILQPHRQTSNVMPDDYGVSFNYADVWTTDSIMLKGYYIHSTLDTSYGTIILLHGIGAGKEHMLSLAADLAQRGINTVVYDARAHGISGGQYCTYGYKEKQDVSNIIDHIQQHYPSQHIGVWGQSYGGAVALQTLAIDQRLDLGIIESTFSDFRTIVFDYKKRISGIGIHWLADAVVNRAGEIAEFEPDSVKPGESAKQIYQPTLIAHGDADVHISVNYGIANYNNLPASNKELVIVEGGNHYNMHQQGGEEYRQKLLKFIDQYWSISR